MKKAIKNKKIGSIQTRFADILQGQACLSGAASRKTKRNFKRLAAKANRRWVKENTREECHEIN